MRILVTAAEQQEIDCALKAYDHIKESIPADVQIDFTLTGIGTTCACYTVTKGIYTGRLEGNPYSLVINIGIAGSYDLKEFPIGSAAIIDREYFGDLGFDSENGFEDLFKYGIWDKDQFPYTNGALVRKQVPFPKVEEVLAKYKNGAGLTVQTVTGKDAKVKELSQMYSPKIESMEGAAVYYAALMEDVPFFELRTVSNAVGERDTKKWDSKAALNTLHDCCSEIFSALVVK